jgi:hypothetical protein
MSFGLGRKGRSLVSSGCASQKEAPGKVYLSLVS